MIVVVDVVILVGEDDPVEVGEIAVQIDRVVIGAADQVVLASLQQTRDDVMWSLRGTWPPR